MRGIDRRVTGKGLLIDVGEFSSGIFQKELALDRVHSSENIHKQDRGAEKDYSSILMKEDVPVRDEEFQLAHQPEARGQKDSDGDDEGIRNQGILRACRGSLRILSGSGR
jgi:hypothetical protein